MPTATQDKRPRFEGFARPSRLVLGPYADVFAGAQSVLVLGCGRGRFMDSLVLRDVPCLGFEPDPFLRRVAEAKGYRVQPSGPEGLRAFPSTFDGIFLGRSGDGIRGEGLARLLLLVAFALQPGGTFLLRRPRSTLEPEGPGQLRAWAEAAGLESVQVAAVQGDPQDFFLHARRGTKALPPLPPEDEASLLDFQLCSEAAPIEAPLRNLYDLERFESQRFSQGGEDGVLQALFDRIGVTNRYLVEIGCGDGAQCNGAALIQDGWRGLMVDGLVPPSQTSLPIHQEWVSAETIVPLLEKYGVPERFDLLSIDIDGNDYWVWKAIPHRPRVVVIEYNGNLPPNPPLTIPYDPNFQWRGGDHYGASLGALARLGREKGYRLVYCTQAGVNAFFVDARLLPPGEQLEVEELYRPANYYYRGLRSSHDPEGVWQPV